MALFLLALGAVLRPVGADPRASVLTVSQSDWDALNASVSGRLHNGEPMLAPCYTVYDGVTKIPNQELCNELQTSRNDMLFESNFFGAYEESNWGGCQATGEGCSLGPTQTDLTTPLTRPCYQGSVPRKYVDAQGVEDVQKALAFAKEKKLRLVIKNTGHDYSGRSSGPDSFALWTHHIQPPIHLAKDFVPEGCSEAAGDVITFGAGQQFSGIYEFADAHNYLVVGGSCPSVGAAGGWITGGGHSLLSNELGLGVDNVQQLKAVLPNGNYITANRCQNQDIFFALRGGGGGTFGVVTEMSTLVHPKKPMQFAKIGIAGLDPDHLSEFLSIMVANAARWASEGWGGYIQAGTNISGISMGNFLLDHSKACESMKVLVDLANRPFAPGLTVTLGNATIDTVNYNDALRDIYASVSDGTFPGAASTLASRIIREESFISEVNQKKLTSLLTDLAITSHEQDALTSSVPNLVIHAVAPFYYSRNSMPDSDLPGSPGAASITPAWRDGLWHMTHFRQYDGRISNSNQIQRIWQVTHDAMNPIREFTPHAGAYLNEADAFEPEPAESFWGQENYARLLQIKKEVDPDNLLTVHNGVGWDETDEKYRCYPKVS